MSQLFLYQVGGYPSEKLANIAKSSDTGMLSSGNEMSETLNEPRI